MKLALSVLASALLLASAVPALAAGNDKPAAQAQSTAGAANNSNGNTASGDLVTATNPQSVLDALSAAGYPGKLDKMDSGRTSIAVKISGLNTFIDFYDCADDLTDFHDRDRSPITSPEYGKAAGENEVERRRRKPFLDDRLQRFTFSWNANHAACRCFHEWDIGPSL